MEFVNFGQYLSNIISAPINILCDLVLLVTAVVLIIRGAKRGLVSTAIRLVRPLAALLIAFFCCRAFGEFLCNMHLFDGFTESIKNSLSDIVNDAGFQAEHAGQTVTGFTGFIGALLALSGNDELLQQIAGFVTGDEAILTQIAESIVSVVAVVVAFVALLILATLLIRLLGGLIEKLFTLPGLSAVNSILGLIIGILLAAVVCWLLSYVLYFLVTWLGGTFGIPFFAAFGDGKGTYILQYLVNFNPIQWALQTLADSLVFSPA